MKKNILLIIFLTCFLKSFSQYTIEYNGEKINELDENNNQTGIWKLFDEENKILITCEFENGEFIANTNFYKESKLIASYNNEDKLEIFKDSKIISCSFFRKEDKSQTLIDINGKEIDDEIKSYYYLSAGQVMPIFYGGKSKLYEFIGNNFVSNGNKGKVKVQFYIDTKGFTTQIEVKESTNEKLNAEAIRVIRILPRWQPGYQGGGFVNCPYIVPITIN